MFIILIFFNTNSCNTDLVKCLKNFIDSMFLQIPFKYTLRKTVDINSEEIPYFFHSYCMGIYFGIYIYIVFLCDCYWGVPNAAGGGDVG